MALNSLVWKLASPYDAYVAHVAELDHAIHRIDYLAGAARGLEAGLQGSGRVTNGDATAGAREGRFRAQLAEQAAELSGDELEAFAEMLGGGQPADAEADRARVEVRLAYMTRGLDEYFAIAQRELGLLESRHYNPHRPDVARQLRANQLPATTIAEYRQLLDGLRTRTLQPAG